MEDSVTIVIGFQVLNVAYQSFRFRSVEGIFMQINDKVFEKFIAMILV